MGESKVQRGAKKKEEGGQTVGVCECGGTTPWATLIGSRARRRTLCEKCGKDCRGDGA